MRQRVVAVGLCAMTLALTGCQSRTGFIQPGAEPQIRCWNDGGGGMGRLMAFRDPVTFAEFFACTTTDASPLPPRSPSGGVEIRRAEEQLVGGRIAVGDLLCSTRGPVGRCERR
ncbi:hypothetical protein [Salinarimonas chemoclinalis]|uniref:hypothetical protein n=1 Tax=Salinarimonas chemoclinalis TaxID=3241599 RepID=UPI003558E830